VEVEWFIRLLIFGILHWILAIMLLQDLASRKKVLGGRKLPWALIIIFITFVGSLLYLLSHPQIFFTDSDHRDEF